MSANGQGLASGGVAGVQGGAYSGVAPAGVQGDGQDAQSDGQTIYNAWTADKNKSFH